MDSSEAQGDTVKILYEKGVRIAVSFPPNEFRFALVLLKAVYKVAPLPFIKRSIDDVESDLVPKLLPMINYFHWCESCGRDIDERDENTMRFQKNDDVKWRCRVCKPLNPDRPR